MKEKTLMSRFSIQTIGLLLPIILLVGVIAVFLNTGGGLDFDVPIPIEDLSVERIFMEPGAIEIILRNASPGELSIAQVVINDAVWPFSISPDSDVARLNRATLHLEYNWVEGEAYAIRIFTKNAVVFDIEIPVAFSTPQPGGSTFLSFTLIGLYVGILPVFLGILWFPVLRRLERQWITFLMAVTVGLLIYLGMDTLAEAIGQASSVPGPYQGIGLVTIGAVGTFFLLDAISRRQSSIGRSESSKRLSLAYMIALGIGLHNLGEGLAIGAAYNIGEISLGTFLVVGFIIQNITEGLGIISPILRDQPGFKNLIFLGLIGGLPAIVGAWLGGFAPSPTMAVLFLAIGVGAIFEVTYEIGRLIQKDTSKKQAPLTLFAGIIIGMLLLWVTGMFIK